MYSKTFSDIGFIAINIHKCLGIVRKTKLNSATMPEPELIFPSLLSPIYA